ncbi:hypothetical protein M2109_002512 [Paenibacillus sp. PastH-3]|nr:hypothetical protein [Paenibacillus sp. PastH-4]MDH6444292.1 hypothetical protein [Paenibacillus sp. PastF-4]MDH6528195.1 hypothetical protein [Paenibacillus sp. PastH-3]
MASLLYLALQGDFFFVTSRMLQLLHWLHKFPLELILLFLRYPG